MSWAQCVTRHDVERLPHEGKHAHELPQKGAWPRHPHKRASTTSRCCQQVKAEASPIATPRCHHEGMSGAQGAATIGQANVKSTRHCKPKRGQIQALWRTAPEMTCELRNSRIIRQHPQEIAEFTRLPKSRARTDPNTKQTTAIAATKSTLLKQNKKKQ